MKSKKTCDLCDADLDQLGIVSYVKCKICGLDSICVYCMNVHEFECEQKHSIRQSRLNSGDTCDHRH